jgi:hypothetical protein
MSTADIEHRVETLETKYAQLEKLIHAQPARDAWRGVVGMFANDSDIATLHRNVAKVREDDRREKGYYDRGEL